jgi:uncharacterized SAM-binding protein YcdF (DUF218 family)
LQELLSSISGWKPLLTALVMPPVPLLLLVLVGAAQLRTRRVLGWLLVLISVSLLWLTACTGTGEWLKRGLLPPPYALSQSDIVDLKAETRTRPTAIVVLGGGLEAFAPEYGATNLTRWSMERLRYGMWLARQVNAPMAFAGGVGWAQNGQLDPEAKVAARIAETEFDRPQRWTESTSRDTRQNAFNTMALLRPAGVKQVLLVTHGWHMARALAVFRQAGGADIEVRAAPMGLAPTTEGSILDWLPGSEGLTQVRQLLREWLGRLVGACPCDRLTK